MGAYTEVDYDDNIYLVQTNAEADVLLHTGLTAGFDWQATALTDLSLNTEIGYLHYLRHSEMDSLEVAPNSALAWNIYFDDGYVSFFDQFTYSQSVISEAALSGIASLPRFDNNVGTRITWSPGKWLWQAGYSHDIYYSDSSQFNYLNRASEYVFARGARRFAENTEVGVEASASLTTYEVTSQGRNSSVSIGPFLEWQLTPATHITLRGGPTFYKFDGPGQTAQTGTVGSYYLNLDLGQQLTDSLSHHASVARNVSLGINQGSGYLEEFTAGYAVSWSVTQRIGLTISASYEHGNQTLQNLVTVFPGFNVLVNQTEIYDRYGFAPSVSWRATDHLSASLSYNHYLRDSTLADRGYSQNSVGLRLTYSF